jgi:hypothetical protein
MGRFQAVILSWALVAAGGPTVAVAVMITSATASGWETLITCEPAASVIWPADV